MNRHQIKSQLAKLLATEDLVVEHKHVETACFNVHTRVLTLPMWEEASSSVYDMLVGHEVGHALFTEDENWLERYTMNPSFFNIVEDARIEKLMKRKYPGLRKSFFSGYQELSEKDFFDIEGEDISKMNLADRVNLYFKIGNFVKVPFRNADEQDIVKQIDDAETFEDALIAAKRMFDYCNEKREQQKAQVNPPTQVPSEDNQQKGYESEGNLPSPTNSDETKKTEEESESQEPQEEETQVELEEKPVDDLNVKTVEALEEKIRDLVDKNAIETVYIEVPKVDLNRVIAKNEDVHEEIDTWWRLSVGHIQDSEIENPEEYLFGEVDAEFKKFKKSAQKEVNYLVKEFEMKKAADSYARATTSRTGVLDCSKLHTYKYNEDLFKKVTTLSDGKNHGLIFILDWSGSMGNVMLDTIKQLYNLIWFCKKVNIPFEVYAFTNEWNNREDYTDTKKAGFFFIDNSFSLMNLFTHTVNNRDLEHQMINIFRIASHFSVRRNYYSRYVYQYPNRLSLSGTPLNESIVSLHQIIPQFKSQNSVQKVQCVILTDGEANPLKYCKEFPSRKSSDGTPYIGLNSPYYNEIMIRDRKLGKVYSTNGEYTNFTDTMLENIQDCFPETNFIGIRVLEPRDALSFIRRYHHSEKYIEKVADWKKNKSFSIDGSGYQKYFGLSSTALSSDAEFEVKEDATKAQIKNAFKKSLSSKKMNKKVLGEFINLVA